jgi:glutaredoxin
MPEERTVIDVIVSDDCPYCEEQLEVMQKSFFNDEYRVIKSGTEEFNEYEGKGSVDAVPFVVVRNDDGSVKYASKGVHDGTRLRKIERQEPGEPFNWKRHREALVVE